MDATGQPMDPDRVAGVLLGTAAGDALGAGYEFTHPAPGTEVRMKGGGPFGWAPGQWTDDTSMAVGVARGLVAGDARTDAGLDAIADQFSIWYGTGPEDVGNQTRSVLSRSTGGGAQMTAVSDGLSGRTGGNGSLMRTAPVALRYPTDGAACADAAIRVSRLTHSDPQAGQACALWSFAIRHAVLHGDFDGPRRYLAELAGAEERASWSRLLDEAENGAPADFANNGWVVHALQTAWWAITTAPGTGAAHLIGALERAVLAGGDTDTTAAIAGGLLGARWGASAVPDEWRAVLHGYPGTEHDRFGADRLVDLAAAVVAAAG